LQGIATWVFASSVLQTLPSNGIYHISDDELFAQLGRQTVAVFNDFREIMARVHMYQRKWKPARTKGFLRQFHQSNGVFATREQERRAFELPSHFSQDMDGLCFEMIEIIEGHIVEG
jgi:hypothetical protein